MTAEKGVLRGRGSGENPANRFVRIEVAAIDEVGVEPEEQLSPKTVLFRDSSRSAITENDSPDVGGSFSVNPYRGCEHGCIYCYARPTHEWLGLSAGLDFETKIFVKEGLPELLRRELASPKWEPSTIMLSGVTDCYQPVERRLGLTRRVLEVMAECRQPAFIVTKNHLVTRDIDVFREMARHRCIGVAVSVTSLDGELARVLEPRASRPTRRLEAIRALAEAGIPVGVNVAPVIPGLTDHEMPSILAAAAKAGATSAGYVVVRLPYGVADLFESWLERHRPDSKAKVMHRIREMRGGKRNDSTFKTRMRGEGVFADQLAALFRLYRKREGLEHGPELSTAAFRRPVLPGSQMDLF